MDMDYALSIGSFQELSTTEKFALDGGDWQWSEFGKAIGGGAVGGAITGAYGGNMTLPIIGTVPGAVGGGILGAIGGAVVYLLFGWW